MPMSIGLVQHSDIACRHRRCRKVIEKLIDNVIAAEMDIMIIHEPGTINPKEAVAMRKAARDKEVEVVIRTEGAKKSEGVIV